MITRCQAAAWRVLLANSCAGQRSMFTAATSAVPLEQSRFVAPAGADAPTVVLDLDETILHRRSWRDSAKLYTMPTASTGLPFPGAVDTISRHTTNYRFVAVTARFKLCARNTERWLEQFGLHGLPVLYATAMHPRDETRIEFKRSAVQHLAAEGWNPVIGIGDRPSDVAAYLAAGLRVIAVANEDSEEQAVASLNKLRAVAQAAGKTDAVDFVHASATTSVWQQVDALLTKAHASGAAKE